MGTRNILYLHLRIVYKKIISIIYMTPNSMINIRAFLYKLVNLIWFDSAIC
jgi:hypothetical protein